MKKIFVLICICVIPLGVFGQAKKAGVSKEKSTDSLKQKTEKTYESFVKQSKQIGKGGMFKIFQKQTDIYFEIPDSLMGREYMIVNKISSVPMQLNEAGLNKGMNFENKVILFQRDDLRRKVWVKTYNPMVSSPRKDAITQSVEDNFAPSIVDFFEIHTYSPDSTSVVVKVNKVFDGTQKSFNDVLSHTGLGGSVKSDLSYIERVKGFPTNIVVRSVFSTSVNEGGGNTPITIGVTTNLVLLPEKVMPSRSQDKRVGYFTQSRWFFNDKQHALKKQNLITRWRMEPKDSDVEKYLRGELVEPKKPIVFYIDPATPKQWRKYIKQGVDDWQKAFEQAGFKNAIYAKEADSTDVDFDLDDVRYSGITYVASPKANAMGPSVVDPRSGEIIEADVVWWHNVMTSLHKWMRVQMGATNEKVRLNQLSDEQMGESIRFVSSHEIGHTLGLRHNMGASFSYPVDSLRSASFVSKNGISPSIMDYARYNYVAQPQDSVPVVNPMIGAYDKYAIEWGYRWFNDEEKMNAFLREYIDKHANDPIYFYGEQQNSKDVIDPRSQSEDLGDNSVKASLYGVENLKRVTQSILEWTYQKDEDYYNTGKLYREVILQWQQYNYHVLANIGGIYLNNAVFSDGKQSYIPVEKSRQMDAVNYLKKNVLTIPEWLFLNKDILNKTFAVKDTPLGAYQTSPYTMAREYQYAIIYDLLSDDRLLRMMDMQLLHSPDEVFTAEELFSELRTYIFKSTKNKKSLSVWERTTQKNYVDALIVSLQKLFEKTNSSSKKLQPEFNSNSENALRQMNFSSLKRVSEVTSLKRGELMQILKLIRDVKGDKLTEPTEQHYKDLTIRIEQNL